MLMEPANTMAVKEVELALDQLDGIYLSPSTLKKYLSLQLDLKLSPSELADIISSDPAMAVLIFTIAKQQRIYLPDNDISINKLLENISLRQIRDAVISADFFLPTERNKNRIILKKQLTLCSLAVAHCARDIAEIATPRLNPDTAYLAGLLHNIGNIALEQVMPKSFAAMDEEAQNQNSSITDVQRKNIGLDYTIIGKRLAERWNFPKQIIQAIWLHRSDPDFVTGVVPRPGIINIIQLAAAIINNYRIDNFQSLGTAELPEQLLKSLSITSRQTQQISQQLPDKLKRKAENMDKDDSKEYFEIIHKTAAQLAQENTSLVQHGSELQTSSNYLDFTRDFLSDIDINARPMDVAEKLALKWQSFYQTPKVCICLFPAEDSEVLEAVVIDGSSVDQRVLLNRTKDFLIPQGSFDGFSVLNARQCNDWLFEHIGFNINDTKVIPLVSNDKLIGMIAFEFNRPLRLKNFEKRFEVPYSVATKVLAVVLELQQQKDFAEKVVHSLKEKRPDKVRQTLPPPPQSPSEPENIGQSFLEALTEIAAGAAHELNNPLLVISGRAQLLNDMETDPEKKHVLEQIKENTEELSGIVNELMDFANPVAPRKSHTSIKQIIDEALQLASLKTNTENIPARIEITDGLGDVFVDSAQVASALANVIANSIESYTDYAGPVKIVAASAPNNRCAQLQIMDFGCGMDARTLKKATHPFFSAKQAGRKRGMGLAQANRLIQLNGGQLQIDSNIDSGSCVTITLPFE